MFLVQLHASKIIKPRQSGALLFMQPKLFKYDVTPDLHFFEQYYLNQGYQKIAGIDEAGRGPLAGPVVAAAVILAPDRQISGLNDSKKLTSARRQELYPEIMSKAVAVGIGIASNLLIEQINILQATRQAMLDAVNNLAITPDFLLIDGITPIDSRLPQQNIKKGDSRSASIAAASIIAKVTRDGLMLEYHQKWPQYSFDKHKGYGSKAHLAAIRQHGPSPVHRATFRGVREFF